MAERSLFPSSSKTTVLAAVLAAIVSTSIAYRVCSFRIFVNKTGMMPGTWGWPWLGEMIDYVRHGSRMFQLKRILKYGSSNFITHLFFQPMILVGKLKDVQMVLGAESRGGVAVDYPKHFQALFGRHAIAVVTGDAHTRLRKLMGPAFSRDAMNYSQSVIRSEIKSFLNTLASEERAVHNTQVFKILTLRMLIQIVFGSLLPEDRIVKYELLLRDWLGGLGCMFPVRLPRWFPAQNAFTKAMNAREQLLTMIHEEISKRACPVENGSLMQRLHWEVQSGAITRDEVADNLLILFVAGHDTTYTAMSSIISTLYDPKRYEVLQQLRSKSVELRDIYIREVLRVLSPFDKGARVFPYGASLAFYTTAIHEDKVLNSTVHNGDDLAASLSWDRCFRPQEAFERYREACATPLAANGPRKVEPFYAFGGGTRACLGENLAMLELREFISLLVTNYKVTLHVNSVREETFPLFYLRSDFSIQTL